MKPDIIYGLVQHESEQGLDNLLLNNYPHLQQKLESQLSSKTNPNQKTYTKSHWHKFIERELEKLHKYDYDITFQRCPEVCAIKNARKYKKISVVKYQCECGQKWESFYQKIIFHFQLVSQKSFSEDILLKRKPTKGLSKKSLQFGYSLVKQLQELVNLTVYPYFLRYQLTIDDQKCGKCNEMTIARLGKSKISVLSKMFCRQICQILTQKSSSQQKQTKVRKYVSE